MFNVTNQNVLKICRIYDYYDDLKLNYFDNVLMVC